MTAVGKINLPEDDGRRDEINFSWDDGRRDEINFSWDDGCGVR